MAWREAHEGVQTTHSAAQTQKLTGSPERPLQQPDEQEADPAAQGETAEQRPNEETQARIEYREAEGQVDEREPVPAPQSQEQEASSEDELMSEREEESQAHAPPPEAEAEVQAEAHGEAEAKVEAEVEAEAEGEPVEEDETVEPTADVTTSALAEPAEEPPADPSSAESNHRSGSTSHHSSWPEAGQRTSAPAPAPAPGAAPLTTPPLPEAEEEEHHTHHLRLAPFAHAHPLVTFQGLQDLNPDPARLGREGATYARVRAEIIDVMPRRPSEWVRAAPATHSGEKRLTFALLLREEAREGKEEGPEAEGPAETRRCLPLIVADGAARIFLGLEGLQEGLDEQALVARAKRAVEGLTGWSLSDTGGSGEQSQHRETRTHEWGVAVWFGRKGRRMHSVWGCEIVDGQ